MNDRQFEETADAAPAAAPAVGHEETAAVAAVEPAALRWRPLDDAARTGQPMLLRGGAKAAREGRPEWVGYWHEGAAKGMSMWDQWGTWEQEPAEYVPLAAILAVVSARPDTGCGTPAPGGKADPVAIETAQRLCDDALRHAAAMQRERDEARVAGRELVAENAVLRADREWWRSAARQLAANIMRMVAGFDAAVAENARERPLERGKEGRGAE